MRQQLLFNLLVVPDVDKAIISTCQDDIINKRQAKKRAFQATFALLVSLIFFFFINIFLCAADCRLSQSMR
jgi:hypothetical protein